MPSALPFEKLYCSDPNCAYCRDLRLLTEQMKQGRNAEPENSRKPAMSVPEHEDRAAA